LSANHLKGRPRKTRRQLDLVEGVAIALEKGRLLSIEAVHMVAIRRLQNAHERLRIEAAGDDRQLRYRTLEPVTLKKSEVAKMATPSRA
jgi:hypothetical protein